MKKINSKVTPNHKKNQVTKKEDFKTKKSENKNENNIKSGRDNNEIVSKKMKELSICNFCQKVFKLLKDLKQHVSAVPLGLKDFKCSNCDKGFGTHGGLTRHIKTVHEGHKIHICDLCLCIYVFMYYDL